jgi:hypothetical protein
VVVVIAEARGCGSRIFTDTEAMQPKASVTLIVCVPPGKPDTNVPFELPADHEIE